MFVTSNQFYLFVLCVFIGNIVGIIYSLFSGVKGVLNNAYLKNLIDFLFVIVSAFIFVLLSHKFFFPSFRIYMLVGLLVGYYLYLKSFYIILAKFSKKLYNKIRKKLFVKITLKRRKNKDGKIKSRKTYSCDHGRGCIVNNNSSFDISVSIDKHKLKK